MTKLSSTAALEHLRRVTNERLKFLFDEYGFREADAEILLPGMWVNLRNATTQVSVQFEYDSGLWVTVGRLVTFEGNVLGGERFNLDFLLMLRAPHLVKSIQMNEYDERAIARLLSEAAATLAQYADDILRGDFQIFGTLKDMRNKLNASRLTAESDGEPR